MTQPIRMMVTVSGKTVYLVNRSGMIVKEYDMNRPFEEVKAEFAEFMNSISQSCTQDESQPHHKVDHRHQ